MNQSPNPDERTRQWITQWLDGDLDPTEMAELKDLLRSDPKLIELVVEQLVLDAMLLEEYGTESLTALVDLVGIPTAPTASGVSALPTIPARPISTNRSYGVPFFGKRGLFGTVLRGLAVVAAVVVAFVAGRWHSTAFAKATTIVRAALETHAEPVERVYIVQTERPETADAGFKPPRDVCIVTQGDRFYVEMNRGERRWFWGQDVTGNIWLTVGNRRAIVVAPDEIGPPLQYISNLYSLELESLLDNFLKHCRLQEERPERNPGRSWYRINVTPRYRWRGGWFKHATIEVDRETKVVRRLIIEREIPQQGTSTVTFTLIDSRPPDETKYRPEGHLTEPYDMLTGDTQPDQRRELLKNWFGPQAERWLKVKEKSP